MKITAAPRILVVASVCVLALISLVVNEGAARQSGQEILLPMEAVDPRSLLQGHYVALNLAHRIDGVCPPDSTDEWIALRQRGEAHELAGAAGSREQAQLLGLPVKGSFTCMPGVASIDEAVPPQPGLVTLNIGVDRFHINQADALRIESVLRDQVGDQPQRAFAIVSIGRDGRARLLGLMVDGERLDLNWL